ncbi:ABC transporter ATP-binding protein [Cellulosimicrobium cellulans]|uniref:ABC transporter ATP-binding protein n=1 Tax=Cellulosimicrobium cellulans TaxID=1710 RepID=UPI0018DEEBFB|nr:ATP-binding cassette domain-containing protein [Cellulosimicrobium cellulans]
MTERTVAVEARAISFAFPLEQPILDHVDLTVGREAVALTGTSGTGKTTLLHCLSGILVPSSGAVSVTGHVITGMTTEERSAIRRRHVGMVFQFSELIAELTLLENVSLPLELLGSPRRVATRTARDLLGELGISQLAQRYPAQVSGGQAQRAAVARALIHEPSVVLADEPTGALDAATGGRVLELLLDAARSRGAAVVLATHDAAVAALADRVVDMAEIGAPHGARPHPVA